MVANLLSNPTTLQNLMFLAPKFGITMPMIGILVEAFNDKEIFAENGLINESRAKVYEEKLASLRENRQSHNTHLEVGCPTCGYIMKVEMK